MGKGGFGALIPPLKYPTSPPSKLASACDLRHGALAPLHSGEEPLEGQGGREERVIHSHRKYWNKHWRSIHWRSVCFSRICVCVCVCVCDYEYEGRWKHILKGRTRHTVRKMSSFTWSVCICGHQSVTFNYASKSLTFSLALPRIKSVSQTEHSTF